MKNKNIKNKISVLQVLPHLNSGGLVSGAVEIATALKKQKLNSIVVSSGGYKENELMRANVTIEKIPADSKNIFTLIENKKRLIKLIKKYNVNIIHARSRAPAWSSYWAAKELNLPFVTTFHGTYGLENLLKKKYNSIMLKSNAVIAISNFIKSHIEEEYKYNKKIHVIPRGVDINIFSPKAVSVARIINTAKQIKMADDDKIILMPGRLTSWKGHKLALEAVSYIKEKKIKLVIVGDSQNRNKYKKNLIRLVNTYQIESKVIFIENTRDLPAFLMLSDLVLSCSTKPEAFGRTTLEAQAMGKPVVAFNHGGSIELVRNNENGILSEVGNASELAKNIENCLAYSTSKRKKIAVTSIENVKKNYLTEYMCKKTINLYKNLINKFRLNEKNFNN